MINGNGKLIPHNSSETISIDRHLILDLASFHDESYKSVISHRFQIGELSYNEAECKKYTLDEGDDHDS